MASRNERGHQLRRALFADVFEIEHPELPRHEHTRIMASKKKPLSPEEFASLLIVGNTSAVTSPPAVIPAEHSARLIAMGDMVELSGRLRMTTQGRMQIYAGQLITEVGSQRHQAE